MNRQAPSRAKTIFAFIAIYVIWGSTYLAIRYAIESVPPLLMMGARSFIAGLILFFWSRLRGNGRIEKEHWRALVIIGASFFLVAHGLLAWAEVRVLSGLAAVLVASEPLWIVTIESFFLKDARVTKKGIFGLILGFGAIVFLIASTEGISSSKGDTIASLAIVFGAISWSGGAVYSRVAKLPESPLLSAGMELMIGGFLLLIAGVIFGEAHQFSIAEVSTRSFLALGYLIALGSVTAFSSYVWLLGNTSATRVSTHTYVNPLIAVLLGWLIADEHLTVELLIATVFIIISVFLVLYDQTEELSDERMQES